MSDIITVNQQDATITVSPAVQVIETDQTDPVIEINDALNVVTVNGEVSPSIEVATGRSGVVPGNPLYIQPNEPVGAPAEYLWIQTGLGDGTDITFWVEDGL